MSSQKTHISSPPLIKNSLPDALLSGKDPTSYFKNKIHDVIQGRADRDIETLTSMGVLENQTAWENFKKSSCFHKNRFPLILTLYLKIYLGLSVE